LRKHDHISHPMVPQTHDLQIKMNESSAYNGQQSN